MSRACEVKKPARDELCIFRAKWTDYVSDLTGVSSWHKLRNYYLDQRAWLVRNLPQPIYRLVHLPNSTDLLSVSGHPFYAGRYWSLCEQVAKTWCGHTCYDESAPRTAEPTTAYVLTTIANLDDIDVVATIACQIGSSYEQEVRLKEGREVLLSGFYRRSS